MATVGEYVQASMLPACVYPPSGQYCTESLPSGCRRIPGPITRNPVLSFWQTHPTTVAGENSPPRPALRGCGAAAIPRGPPPPPPQARGPAGTQSLGGKCDRPKGNAVRWGPRGDPHLPHQARGPAGAQRLGWVPHGPSKVATSGPRGGPEDTRMPPTPAGDRNGFLDA